MQKLNSKVVGPVMLDIESYELTDEDKQLISSRLVGGVILFTRNFRSAEQVFSLTQSIRSINSSIIIAVDQEGGRVQRFNDQQFSKLPALARIGELYKLEPQQAVRFSREIGELMALEVQAVGCDISFAPVLDLGLAISEVIGDRAFSTDVEEIILLARAYMQGMRDAGMAATGKHFPGHGSVAADSHLAVPYDDRCRDQIESSDLRAFAALSTEMSATMPAHVVYSKVDSVPAGFSSIWLQQILRNSLGFNGVIFSDDLSMKGAEVAGDFPQRANSALVAGCDMVLVCNNRPAAIEIIEALKEFKHSNDSQVRLNKLLMKNSGIGLKSLHQTARWRYLHARLSEFNKLTNKI